MLGRRPLATTPRLDGSNSGVCSALPNLCFSQLERRLSGDSARDSARLCQNSPNSGMRGPTPPLAIARVERRLSCDSQALGTSRSVLLGDMIEMVEKRMDDLLNIAAGAGVSPPQMRAVSGPPCIIGPCSPVSVASDHNISSASAGDVSATDVCEELFPVQTAVVSATDVSATVADDFRRVAAVVLEQQAVQREVEQSAQAQKLFVLVEDMDRRLKQLEMALRAEQQKPELRVAQDCFQYKDHLTASATSSVNLGYHKLEQPQQQQQKSLTQQEQPQVVRLQAPHCWPPAAPTSHRDWQRTHLQGVSTSDTVDSAAAGGLSVTDSCFVPSVPHGPVLNSPIGTPLRHVGNACWRSRSIPSPCGMSSLGLSRAASAPALARPSPQTPGVSLTTQTLTQNRTFGVVSPCRIPLGAHSPSARLSPSRANTERVVPRGTRRPPGWVWQGPDLLVKVGDLPPRRPSPQGQPIRREHWRLVRQTPWSGTA